MILKSIVHSVPDKSYSRFTELVKQDSGKKPRIVKDIGLINLIQSSGKNGGFT